MRVWLFIDLTVEVQLSIFRKCVLDQNSANVLTHERGIHVQWLNLQCDVRHRRHHQRYALLKSRGLRKDHGHLAG